MSNIEQKIYRMASGDILVWVGEGGGICLRPNSSSSDPIELGESEALDLANLLIRLVKEQTE